MRECKLGHEVCCTVRYDFDNSPYENQINTVLKDNQDNHPKPSLENDEKYVPYGENNQADVTELKPPPLGNKGELQTPTDNGYEIEPANQSSRDDIRPADRLEVPIDYNQIPADTNRQEQYQTGMRGHSSISHLNFFLSRLVTLLEMATCVLQAILVLASQSFLR